MSSLESQIEYFRSLSIILHPEKGNTLNGVFFPNDVESLNSHYEMITDEFRGHKQFAEKQLEVLDSEFQEYQQTQVNIGRQRPLEYPYFIRSKRYTWLAKLEVFKEELEKIDELLLVCAKERTEKLMKVPHRKYWGTSKLVGGIVRYMNGWRVLPNKQGLLSISDTRSSFDGLELHRFSSEVLAPMRREESYRQKMATRKARETGTPKEAPKHVKTPIFDAKTNTIEYVGYSKDWVSLTNKKNKV